MSSGEHDPLVGTLVDGRYKILERIAAGGMGVVYRAEQVFLKHHVVLKRLHRELTGHGQAMERFTREAQAAVRIDHPNVCRVLDCGVDATGAVYIAMELLEGRLLSQRIARSEPLPLPEIVDIGAQLCAALERAHALGIVHRDLKPDNVMLVPRADGSGVTAKIMDFGVAKIAHDVEGKALTQAGMVFGTPKYMAPEQAAGEKIDARADLYALGVILFEMATGRVPFESPTLSGLLTKHLTEPAPTLEAVAPQLSYPLQFRELVARCLVKDPDYRIKSAVALGEALRACAGMQASVVGPQVTTPDQTEAPTVLVDASRRSLPTTDEVHTTGFDRSPGVATTAPAPRRRKVRLVAGVAALVVAGAAAFALLRSGNGPADERPAPAVDAARVAVGRDAESADARAVPPPPVGPASPPADASSGDADATGPAEEPGEVDAGEAGEAWPPGPEGEALAAAEERRAFEARVPEVGRALAQAADGNTRGALELLGTLAATFENDAHYHFELALLLDRAAQPLEAVRHAQRAVFLDPRYTGDAELHAVAERGLLAAASAETAARFLGLIVDAPLAERLVRFVLEPTGTLDAARRVHELLEHRDLLDGVSPYLRWSLLVVVTEDCASRRALLAEIAAAPDGRMWPYLRRFESETGCGRRKRNDCWPCERAALRGALAAVSGAAVVAGMSIDPVADAAP